MAVIPAQYSGCNMYGLPVRKLKEIMKKLVPETSLDGVEELKSTMLFRWYILHMLDGSKLFLAYSPSLYVRLLRHEGSLLRSEALLLQFLTSCQEDAPSSSQEDAPISSQEVCTSQRPVLRSILPKVLKLSSDTRELGLSYTIFTSHTLLTPSTTLLDITSTDKPALDKQLGLLTREIASFTSPTGTFGPAIHVLTNPETPTTPPPHPRPENQSPNSWSLAFNLLFEGVLRDGEDMSILLPYESIRIAYLRLSRQLDAVIMPRLFMLDMGHEGNVVCAKSGSGARIEGLRSWSHGIFGDPMLAYCFDSPSEMFLEGWKEGGEEVIEDQDNVDVRRLLYRCFRAAVDIVTQFYQPSGDSCRELAARKRLTRALAELEEMDVRSDER